MLKCIKGLYPKDIIRAAKPATLRPARLHIPWKEAITDLPYNASTPTACVLTEIFNRLPKNPNTNKVHPNCQGVETKPNEIKVRGYKSEAIIITLRLPKRPTSHPEIGKLAIRPTGSANKTVPKPASLK
jgi:hypothetical protein